MRRPHQPVSSPACSSTTEMPSYTKSMTWFASPEATRSERTRTNRPSASYTRCSVSLVSESEATAMRPSGVQWRARRASSPRSWPRPSQSSSRGPSPLVVATATDCTAGVPARSACQAVTPSRTSDSRAPAQLRVSDRAEDESAEDVS